MIERFLTRMGLGAAVFLSACVSSSAPPTTSPVPSVLTTAQAQTALDAHYSSHGMEVLGVRYEGDQAIAKVRIFGIEGAEIDVAFRRFDTGWLPDQISVPDPAFPIFGLVDALESGRQLNTMRDMRLIAAANAAARVDLGTYMPNLFAFGSSGYMEEGVILNDAWGSPFMYTTGVDTYTIASMGSDGAAGPAPPQEWHLGEAYDVDIVLTDGVFTQAPMYYNRRDDR